MLDNQSRHRSTRKIAQMLTNDEAETIVHNEVTEKNSGYGAMPKFSLSNSDKGLSRDRSESQIDITSADMEMEKHVAEPSLVLFFQVLFPFLIAGFGMVLAGTVLDIVQHWNLFKEVPETFILVPALLGLKGNLEMTLASRLSTQANCGKMDTREQVFAVVLTNIALIQVQAIVVTFLASAFAMVLSWVPKGQIDWSHAALLCASGLTTASLASFVLSIIMISVVITARKFNVNPDNIATPIAASLGDLTTLAVLSCFGSLFLSAHLSESWLNVSVILFFIMAAPIWTIISWREESTRTILQDGWSPIIFSMCISSGGGFVLETAMRDFPQMAPFQPVMNGVGGNLAAVQASRISTFFHKYATPGLLPYKWTLNRFTDFSRAFFSADWDSRSARVLLFLLVPGHIIFNWLIALFHTGENLPSSALFTSLYLTTALAQVMILLYVCQFLVSFMWSRRIDPDNAAIPYLTALGDLVGTTFLYLAFSFLQFMHDPAGTTSTSKP